MEQISEEFADKLIHVMLIDKGFYRFPLTLESQKLLLKAWKEEGYIKQSREEEIRNLLKECQNEGYYRKFTKTICLMEELIEILDNKLKENKNV